MTRREEISNASNNYVAKTHSPSINEFQTAMNIAVVKSFVAGAEWADKTMIEKACEWAKKRFDLDYCSNVKDLLDYLKSLVEE